MNRRTVLTNKYMVCFLAMICCILWGSAFPTIKTGYKLWEISAGETGSQILFAGYRFTLAGILTICIGSVLQKKILLPERRAVLPILFLALFQTVIQYFFFYVGLSNTTGVKGSIITATNVFLSIVIASIIFRQEKMTKQKMLGCLFGFVGVVLVNIQSESIQMSFTWNGDGFIFLSALSSSISAVLIKRFSKENNPVVLSGFQFMLGGIVLIIGGYVLGGDIGIKQGNCIAILLYLAFVSAIAYSLWGILLKYNTVSKVTVYGFMNPVTGVFLSALLLQEKQNMGGYVIFALLLVCIGIYVVNREKEAKK